MYNATTDFANAATHNGSPGISWSKKQIFFRASSISEALFSLCVGVCVQAFIPNLPLPQSQIDTSLLLQSWYQRTIPALTVHPLVHTHTHIFCLCKQMNGSVFPHRPLSTPTHLPGNITPNGPGLCTHLSGYCWGNWPLTPPLGNWCRRRQKCAAYSLLHWRKRSPVPSIDLIFPPLCSL